jgi:glycosyltransferase involved in cell wall biosynthesis
VSRILWLSSDRGVDPSVPKGASAHLRNTVRAFSQLGHEVLVLTPSPADAGDLGAAVEPIETPGTFRELLVEAQEPVPREQRDRRRRRLGVVRALGHAWNQVAVEQALHRHVPRFRPDFVFERYSRFGVAGVLTSRRLGVPHLLNVHAQLAWEAATFRGQALADGVQELEAIAFEQASRIVVNSAELRGQLIESGVGPEKVHVVVNGVHLDRFRPEGPVRRPVKDADAIVLGFVGSLKPWHGLELLAEAFRRLSRDPRWHLLVVGDGPERKVVRALAEELPGRVTATGAVPLAEVPEWTRGADLTVAPYPALERFYYSPLKVLESLACGRAVVASGIGQVNELVRDGETGLLVPPGEVEALVAALRRFADEPELGPRLGLAARQDAEARHSWTARARELVAHGLEAGA